METPDKLFVHTGRLGFLCASKINITGNDVEYIRADLVPICQKTSCESRIMTREMIEGRLLQNDTESWKEDYNEEDLQTRFAFYTYKCEPRVLYLSNLFVEEASRNRGLGTKILKAAEKVAETMGASSIGLKVKQDSPANAWYRKNGYGYVASEYGYDWLEKTLKSV